MHKGNTQDGSSFPIPLEDVTHVVYKRDMMMNDMQLSCSFKFFHISQYWLTSILERLQSLCILMAGQMHGLFREAK